MSRSTHFLLTCSSWLSVDTSYFLWKPVDYCNNYISFQQKVCFYWNWIQNVFSVKAANSSFLITCVFVLLVSSDQVISYNKGSTVYGSQFKGRVGFVNQMPSQDVSLLINKTLESDSGRYACQVITSGTVPFVTEFSLNVKGERKHFCLQ